MGAEHHSPTGCEYSGACDSSCRSAGPDAGRKHSGTGGTSTSTSRNAGSSSCSDAGAGCNSSSGGSHARSGNSCCAANVVRGANRFRG